MTEPILNSETTLEMTVGNSDLASTLSIQAGDEFPAVLATARMIALMEIASARLLHSCLAAGESSVGVAVQVSHTAPTPNGVTVTVHTRYTGREGKLFSFEVSAFDPGGEIGRGLHQRAIISTERLETRATKRVPSV